MSLAEYEDFVFTRRAARPRPTRSRRGSRSASGSSGWSISSTARRDYRVVAANGTDVRMSVAGHDAGSTATATRTSPTARSSPARSIDSVERADQLQLPRRPPRPRVRRRAADVQERQGRRRQRDQGRGVPHLACSTWTPAAGSSASARSARTTASPATRRNTLFDEKIGGTVHFALGAGYPETGNTNQSRPALGHGRGPAPRRAHRDRRGEDQRGRQVHAGGLPGR